MIDGTLHTLRVRADQARQLAPRAGFDEGAQAAAVAPNDIHRVLGRAAFPRSGLQRMQNDLRAARHALELVRVVGQYPLARLEVQPHLHHDFGEGAQAATEIRQHVRPA